MATKVLPLGISVNETCAPEQQQAIGSMQSYLW